jgi:hypothetical protein
VRALYYFLFLVVPYNEGGLLFMERRLSCELSDFSLSHLIGHHPKSCTHTSFLTLVYNTPPWPIICYVYASLKTPAKNPVGKKGRRKEYITRIAYVAPVASLKTLHEKTLWKKVIKGKRVQQLIFGSGLQDRLMIFRIHDHEL